MKLFLALYTVLMVGTASAAQITEEVLPQGTIIRVSGQFDLGDDREFIKIALLHERSLIIFGSSPGGSLDAAIGIGRAIKILRLPTSVATNAECASACAYAWLAGQDRYMEPNARLGFHAASQEGKISGSANAILGAYLNELDLNTEAIIYLTDTEPESMTWLDFAQVNTIGITVKESAAIESVANVEPKPTPTQEIPKSVVPSYFPDREYWHVRAGVDFSGFDIGEGSLASDRETCQTQCRDNGECKAYTFNTRNNMCFIKNDVGTAYKNAAAISGYRGQPILIKESVMIIREEIDYPDADPALQVVDYAHHKNVAFDWCLQKCEVTDYCKAFTYVHRIRDCWLKSNAVRSSKSRKGVTSGIKAAIQ
jgi:hypothetical protein